MAVHMAGAQTVARITVNTGAYARYNTPVSFALGKVNVNSLKGLVLYQLNNGSRQAVPVRVETGPAAITWQLAGEVKPGVTLQYELVKGKEETTLPDNERVTVEDDHRTLTVLAGNHPVLRYQYTVMEPPPGVDTAFRRSGFIHPAWTPGGKVLTNIQPKDHYHHYGIWNPWTDTEFEGETVDFWNLKKRSGTVRFSRFNSKTGGFNALQEHVVFKKNGTEKVAMNEEWDVDVYPYDGKTFMWDFTSRLQCATASPITLNQYRYGGGFAIRGNAEWNNENSAVLTSEGKTRKNADSTHARWLKIAGNLKDGLAGLLILSAPANFRAPQPVRVWPEKDQHGQVFGMFSPTKDYSWTLQPGKTYTQSYRVITFDKDLTAEQAEAYWNDFAHPPKVTGRLVK
ncbi:PmoA family protein [Chitinophaga alhagiae]|nr:PmoA family protein [Chitinophaga alhagiae]